MTFHAQFPNVPLHAGMYESFYLRAVSPDEPVGAWIRYTVEKAPGLAARGSLWVSVFDADAGAPFTHRQSSEDLTVPADGWIEVGGDSRFGPARAQGHVQLSEAASASRQSGGPAEGRPDEVRWTLDIRPDAPELRHFKQPWLYRAPLPRTKLTSPAPAARFDGTIELPGRTLQLDGWRGMVGHNWGSEHAERWIWLHGIDFREDANAWLDVALGRVLVAGRLTPWMASGAICIDGRRSRLGGLGARGLKVAESPARCSLTLPGEHGLTVEAHVDTPPGSSAEWRYNDPGADSPSGEHYVSNCSVASLALNVRPHILKRTGTRKGAGGTGTPKGTSTLKGTSGEAARTLHTAHGAAYELGVSAAGR